MLYQPSFSFIFILLPFFFLYCSSSSSSSSSSSLGNCKNDGGLMKWGYDHPRMMVESVKPNTSLVLAANRTYRRDPLYDFKPYSGGWNISDHHYWTSVAFTAAPFFVIAAAWFIVFGLTLLCTCFYFFCCQGPPYGYSRVCYALSLFLLILFTIAAIIGCFFLYLGQGKFYASTTTTLEYVVNQATFTADKLNNISQYLSEAKNIGVESFTLPEDIQSKINEVQTKIDSAATDLSVKTKDNSRKIQRGLNSVRLNLIVLAAVMLFLAFLGFLLSIFGVQCLVYALVILGWLLVTLTFILCGIFLLLHNVVADTCVAIDQWVQNPTAHTALDDILPCVDEATTQETLVRSKEATYEIVNLVDVAIKNYTNVNPSATVSPFNFNQSGPLMPLLCNPFNSDLTNRTCAVGEVDLGNATKVYKDYVCESRGALGREICMTRGRLTPKMYKQMSSAVEVSYGLYEYTPFLVELEDCSFVRNTFKDISSNHCPGLRKNTKWIYVGLVLVADSVMLSLILWVVYARERRHRVYTKKYGAYHRP